jgi:hypothetical protein
MDAKQFDTMTRAWASPSHRRTLLTRVGVGLGVLIAGSRLSPAEADKKHRKAKHRKTEQRKQGRKKHGRVGNEAEATKVYLCHRTSSETNDYNYLEVSMIAAEKHRDHHGDYFNVDLSTDKNNCGECGNVCAAGSNCVNGTCTSVQCAGYLETCSGNCCPGDGTVCCNDTRSLSAICRDPRNVEYYLDPANCGGCGIVCNHSEASGGGADCIGTINLPVTEGGDAVCVTCGSAGRSQHPDYCKRPNSDFGDCVNLQGDRTNCGTCGKICNPGETCVSGTCTAPASCSVPEDCPCVVTCLNTEDLPAGVCGRVGVADPCNPGQSVQLDCGPCADPNTKCCDESCWPLTEWPSYCPPL